LEIKTRGSPQAGLSSFLKIKNRQLGYKLPVLPYFKIGRITKRILKIAPWVRVKKISIESVAQK